MGLTTCPNCGSPNSAVKQKKNKHKGVIISIIVFALIVVSAFRKKQRNWNIIQIWKQYLLQ